ncbi:MAG: threonine synthase [Candidatus Doudnabacteria bacterium RIFCSPLOWO2_02_FULL_49_13]|uniref:Threonine synthase n=1 Tax=Candidatus Doudnabacteria bacterium RIFCSPHIGHO2_12_FULL_48_16 TaxID=1817838 RepID=A0A1F5PL70_9BACT|nr:MAG: threonine synthase [Candidatus Doudnabacteria bacterium RIFCSPHIGHO2_02_FULL_49_24]OGE88795.1 MAG: threonine synthase [Candidatus Doudnabacteria bacterium RIFCSPHIGHO2_01_FULL_50_67]OGE90683.1 MAG: threonine synthase [Candidatus Doudnabacteria bacterium RIFCSPHIGHO2_12_FULL_48_16]OGE97014.1 MAG: threonine synthase [Candidatus Doudnabacteria bacterium RIFCSPLOWO2_01_FULL_49_40]OGF02548.1 MAG: threonine synthase [Candidatus Doudnabacteria bacterium RIFCSPLOWO2_02_FULL_49_13]
MRLSFYLECSVPCGAGPFDPRQPHHLCECGMPLLVRYNLDAACKKGRSAMIMDERSMWRYSEVMPLLPGEAPVSLGEGWTPLVHAERLGRELGLTKLFVKDESLNPTNSFKARGLSAAVTRAMYLGAQVLSIPTAGNAGCAMAAYAAKAGLEAQVFMPRDVKTPFIRECELYGAKVTLVDGLITDAGRIAAETGGPLGWYDVSTLKEPYRIEGKKIMGYELAEQFGWRLPDWIIYPTGGGTGMVGMWKAFEEMSAMGWIDPVKRPHMVTVQAANCAPIVRAFDEGTEKARPWENATTIADGLRVPRAIGDFLVLRAVRESQGAAVAVADTDMVQGMRDLGRFEGINAAPEGGAAMHAVHVLREAGSIKQDDTVVVFNTGGMYKYIDVLG